jgi:hypothetical protein
VVLTLHLPLRPLSQGIYYAYIALNDLQGRLGMSREDAKNEGACTLLGYTRYLSGHVLGRGWESDLKCIPSARCRTIAEAIMYPNTGTGKKIKPSRCRSSGCGLQFGGAENDRLAIRLQSSNTLFSAARTSNSRCLVLYLV